MGERRVALAECTAAEPADVAATVAWLVGPAAGRVSGQVIAVDGGWSTT